MEAILHEIDMNITRKKIELLKKQIHNMNKDVDIMDNELNDILNFHHP